MDKKEKVVYQCENKKVANEVKISPIGILGNETFDKVANHLTKAEIAELQNEIKDLPLRVSGNFGCVFFEPNKFSFCVIF